MSSALYWSHNNPGRVACWDHKSPFDTDVVSIEDQADALEKYGDTIVCESCS